MHKRVLPTHGLELPVPWPQGEPLPSNTWNSLVGKPGEMGKGEAERSPHPPPPGVSTPPLVSKGPSGWLGFNDCSLGTNGGEHGEVGGFAAWGLFGLSGGVPSPLGPTSSVFQGGAGTQSSFAGLVRSFLMIVYLVS